MMPSPTDVSPELEALLDYVRRARGFDFTGYKRASLTRRIDKRMHAVGIDDYDAYRAYLEANADEFEQLFDTILINVTGFFRDPETWEFLQTEVIPALLAHKDPREPVRIWSAGCATGEEAYTLAIAFAEAMGLDEYRERVKIYATDADESALRAARHAHFPPKAMEGLPAGIVDKYFERTDSHVAFRKALRRSVVFGRNDLIQDAPISRIDLLTCRNVLMYFDPPTQARIIGRLFFALNEGGYLVLGKAETLLAHMNLFVPVELKRRVFRRVGRPGAGGRVTRAARGGAAMPEADAGSAEIRDSALRTGSVAQIVVDQHGTVVLANDRANGLFRLNVGDVGRPLSDLQASYRPIDLRSLIDQAYAERRMVVHMGVEWRPHGSPETRWFDVQVIPLHAEEGVFLGTSISFADVSAQRQLQAELQQSENELQAAYEELQSTNEELETTNEELQSTVEELETTNEELETMNEELQSTNEELRTMNDEVHLRSEELSQVNRFLEQVFTSVRYGLAVVDNDFRVLVWNAKAEDLWGVRSDEAEGSRLFGLDLGLPVEQLRQPIRTVLMEGDGATQEVVVPATTRRGKSIKCRVVCAPLLGRSDGTPRGVIVTMEEVTDAAEITGNGAN